MITARIAVLGAGVIGARHAEHLVAEPETALHAIVDPADAARDFAASLGAPHFRSLAEMLAAQRPDGLIVATPNGLHVENGLEAIAAGVPVLVEKPLADTVAGALRLVAAGEAAGVPVLTGHHRRHNPMVRKAKDILAAGRIGEIIGVHAFCWFFKPDDYFDVPWRRRKGAGPVLMNLIHDVDLMRHLVGEVASVQAQTSNAVRGNEIEETAAVLLRFANGALGTVNVSDTVVAPWSWELTSGENAAYPRQHAACYQFGGTHGALTLPDLCVTTNQGKRSWTEPLAHVREAFVDADPLREQVRQFARVIRGEEPPLVSGREGLRTLRVIEAVKRAAESGERVDI